MKDIIKRCTRYLNIGYSVKGYKWVNTLMWAYMIVWLFYMCGWCFNFYVKGVADLPALISLGSLMVSPAAIAALVTFIKVKSDANNNGIPDLIEEKNATNIRRERMEYSAGPINERRDYGHDNQSGRGTP